MPSFAGASSSSRAAAAAMDFNQLNSDAFHHVFKFLEPKDLGACARVCKVWYEETQSPLLWRELCVRDHRINPQEYHSVRDWAAEYRSLLLRFDAQWICPGQSQTPYAVFEYSADQRTLEKNKDDTWMTIARSSKEFTRGRHYAKIRVDALPAQLPPSYLDIGLADARYAWTQCWLRYDNCVAAAMDGDLKVGSHCEVRFDAQSRQYQIHVDHALKARGVLQRVDNYSRSGIFVCVAARAVGIRCSIVDYQCGWPEDNLFQRIMRPRSMLFSAGSQKLAFASAGASLPPGTPVVPGRLTAGAAAAAGNDPLALRPTYPNYHSDDGQQSFITQLPIDLVGHVFWFLPTESVIACTQVCRAWHQEASSNYLWRQLCVRDFGLLAVETAEREDEQRNWRAFHKSSVFAFDAEYVCPGQGQLFQYSNHNHTVRKAFEDGWMAIARNTKSLDRGKHFAWFHVDALPHAPQSSTYIDIGIADADFAFSQCWLRYDPVVCGVQDKAVSEGSDVELWFDAITREYRICVDGVEHLSGTLQRPQTQVLSGAYFCVAMRTVGIQCTIRDYKAYWPMESMAQLRKRERKERNRRSKKCLLM